MSSKPLLRLSTERGRPYGDESWARETAGRLELESTPRSRGQPRKSDISIKYLQSFVC